MLLQCFLVIWFLPKDLNEDKTDTRTLIIWCFCVCRASKEAHFGITADIRWYWLWKIAGISTISDTSIGSGSTLTGTSLHFSAISLLWCCDFAETVFCPLSERSLQCLTETEPCFHQRNKRNKWAVWSSACSTHTDSPPFPGVPSASRRRYRGFVVRLSEGGAAFDSAQSSGGFGRV